ncbi:prenyltransferase/squalene oxidase repeat-containing protein [Actinomadura hibisca]|uniref:prenyltransferase/squalene oxidase repeat-containing protein n=1 Tax=Actinomadura hibisca TaxID=68565 RepID=UPI00082BEB94|nr:prenyltransferase/squalene oxidase repeat-containing protein [Actinomadura hibisca]
MEDMIATSLDRAIRRLFDLQHADGHWEGEIETNTMLLSQYVMTRRIVGRWPLPSDDQAGVLRYLLSQRLPDGSWPMHREGPGSLFTTTLAYVALRLLGADAEHPTVAACRAWIRSQDEGALSIPSWGKFWLALLGLYDYRGMNPIPPEPVLAPTAFPAHPLRFFPHVRYMYLGMAYLYGERFAVDLGRLGADLRAELYLRPYDQIDFRRHRGTLREAEVIDRPGFLRRAVAAGSRIYETVHVKALRHAARERCRRWLTDELTASDGKTLSPLFGLLTTLVLHASGADAELLERSLDGGDYWRWEDDQGLRVVSTRSASWDTAFVCRALIDAGRATDPRVDKALAWLASAQITTELTPASGRHRDAVLGGWSFTEGADRWPVSDCTAEALSAIAAHAEVTGGITHPIDARRMEQAVSFILARQNKDGGFGAFEARRAPGWIERLNPSEMYADCMAERSYTECTGSCVTALGRLRSLGVGDDPRTDRAITAGLGLLRSRQQPDGSFRGFWGVNYTYAAFFVAEAFHAAGVSGADPTLRRLAAWLVDKQKTDGGWGEDIRSGVAETYLEHPDSQATMTAWALLSLMSIEGAHHPSVRSGIRFLASLQNESGAWPRQSPAGAVNRAGVIDYRLYKDVFPALALARYARIHNEQATAER